MTRCLSLQTYKRLLIKTGALPAAALALLTLFSNTIYSFNLPGVILDYPHDGVIANEATGEGVVEFSESEAYYAAVGGTAELSVKAGDTVAADAPLYSIMADTDDLRAPLDAAQQAMDEIDVNIRKTTSDIVYNQGLLANLGPEIQDAGSQLSSEILGYEQDIESLSRELRSYEEPESGAAADPEILGYDQQLESLAAELGQESQELGNMQILYDAGGVAKADLDGQQAAVDGIKTQMDQIAQKKENLLQNQTEDVQNKVKDVQSQIDQIEGQKENALMLQEQNLKNANEAAEKDYQTKSGDLNKTLEDLDYQLQSYTLQKQAQAAIAENLKKQIADGGKQTVSAAKSGIVMDISDNLAQSKAIGKDSLVLTLGLTDSPLQTTAVFGDNADFVKAGDDATVTISARGLYNLPGTVKRTFYEDGSFKAIIQFTADDSVTGGEKAEARLKQTSELYTYILPNSAVREDADGSYILYTEREKGSFGYKYYAKRATIMVKDQDIENTAFTIATEDKLAVIVNSDRPVSENDMVRIVDGGDTVEIR